jgi:hypothetical protein
MDAEELVEDFFEFVWVLGIEEDIAASGGEAVFEGVAGGFFFALGLLGPRDLAPLARAVSDLRFDTILVLLIPFYRGPPNFRGHFSLIVSCFVGISDIFKCCD